MLHTLRAVLDLSDPFDACLWAQCTCAFFGLMRFGEVTVKSRGAFDRRQHLSRADLFFGTDMENRPYARLRLPSAKTAKPGDTQDVFLVAEGNGLCPLAALQNLLNVVPASPANPLFSWRDKSGTIRPSVRATAIGKINKILSAAKFGNAFGHSFRIGGASFYLAKGLCHQKLSVCMAAGNLWRSRCISLLRADCINTPCKSHMKISTMGWVSGSPSPQWSRWVSGSFLPAFRVSCADLTQPHVLSQIFLHDEREMKLELATLPAAHVKPGLAGRSVQLSGK